MLELLLLCIVFAASLTTTGCARIYALRHGLVDEPGPRRSHTTPTPHGGGLAIAVTFLCAMLFLFSTDSMALPPFMALFGGGLVVVAIGFWDDHVLVPAGIRITVHFAAAAWALYWLGGFPPLPIGALMWDLGWAGHLIGLVAMVWLLNLFNFMDGIDGIAAVEAISVASSACFLMAAGNSDESLLWLALLGAATLGFLPWNWPPARIFMGDVGSGFLGFSLAVLALHTVHTGALPIWSWIILLGVFVVDATVTLLRRFISGEPWHKPHRSHAYQHAAIRLNSHRQVTLMVLAINTIWLLPLAWFVKEQPENGLATAAVALIPLVVLVLVLGAGRSERNSRATS